MTNNYCTLFDSNYIAYGINLIESLKQHDRNARVYVVTMDRNVNNELQKLDFANVILIKIDDVEKEYYQLNDLKKKDLKRVFLHPPVICRYIMSLYEEIDRLTYLDSDLYFFSSPSPLFDEIGDSSIAIIEHKFSFITKQNLKYGRFNVGWISFARDSQGLDCINNWFDNCIDWCFQKVEPDRYADQKYLDQWPLNYSNLKIIKHKGANLAPWNIANYKINKINNEIFVDEDKLIFFHFANIKQLTGSKFKTNLSRVLVKTSGIIKNNIYVPYLRLLSNKLRAHDLKLKQKMILTINPFLLIS